MAVKLQTLEEATREQTITRLKIIEGQVRGLQGMVDEGRYCVDILVQLAAVQEVLRNAGKPGERGRGALRQGPQAT